MERGGEIAKEIVFPQLRHIDLCCLMWVSFGLKCFYNGMYALHFPSLETLKLNRVYYMTTFSTGSICAPKLQQLEINENNYPCTDGDLNQVIKNKMLENVDIGDHHHFIGICQIAEQGSTGIRNLRIGGQNNFPAFSILGSEVFNKISYSVFQNLEKLHVGSCGGAVERIFELDEQTTFSSLETIRLEHVMNLRHIFYGTPKGFIGFQQLTSLHVTYCNILRLVCPDSVVRGLAHLQHLEISSCCMMEQIVAQKDELGEDSTEKIVLPQLKNIALSDLPSLKCFYNGICDIELPLLQSLTLDRCPDMKTFSSMGEVRAPELQNLQINSKDYPFSGNLNDDILKWKSQRTMMWKLPLMNIEDSSHLKEG